MNIVIIRFRFSCKLVHFSCNLLEISILTCCSDYDTLSKLLDSVNIGIFYGSNKILLKSPPYDKSVSFPIIIPSLHLTAMMAPPTTIGLTTLPIGFDYE